MDILPHELYEHIPDTLFKEGVAPNSVSQGASVKDKSVEVIELDPSAVKDAFSRRGNFSVIPSGLDFEDSQEFSLFMSFRDRPINDRMKLIQRELEFMKQEIDSSEESAGLISELNVANNQLSEIYNSALGKICRINPKDECTNNDASHFEASKVKNCKYELYVDPSTYKNDSIVDRVSQLAARVETLTSIVGTDQDNDCLQKRVSKLRKRIELLSKEGIDSLETKIKDFLKLFGDFEISKKPLVYADKLEYIYEHGGFLKEISASLPCIASQLKYLHRLNIDGIELIENLCTIKNNQDFCNERLDLMKKTQEDLRQNIEENKKIFAQNMKMLEK